MYDRVNYFLFGLKYVGISIVKSAPNAPFKNRLICTSTSGWAVWVENDAILAETNGRCMAI